MDQTKHCLHFNGTKAKYTVHSVDVRVEVFVKRKKNHKKNITKIFRFFAILEIICYFCRMYVFLVNIQEFSWYFCFIIFPSKRCGEQGVAFPSDHFHDNRNECSEQSSNAAVLFYMGYVTLGLIIPFLKFSPAVHRKRSSRNRKKCINFRPVLSLAFIIL